MFHLYQEVVELYRQRMARKDETAWLGNQVPATTPSLLDRLLVWAGNSLISIGLKLKNISQSAEMLGHKPDYT